MAEPAKAVMKPKPKNRKYQAGKPAKTPKTGARRGSRKK